jgi:hypothetical protein
LLAYLELSENVILYADDISIAVESLKFTDLFDRATAAFSKSSDWMNLNKLTLNTNKTNKLINVYYFIIKFNLI